MGWETRNGRGRYLTRSRRVDGRVVREYVGSGETAELIARIEASDRQRAREQRQAEAGRRLEARAVDWTVRAAYVAVEGELRAALTAAGYRRHDRGQWRKRKGTGDMARAEVAAARDKAHEEAFRLLKRAQGGDETTRAALREWFKGTGPEGLRPLQDVAREALLQAACGRNILLAEDASHQVQAQRAALAGPSPSPLESMVVERVLTCWLQVHLYEALYASEMTTLTVRQSAFQLRRIDGAHRRHLSAVKALAQIRRMQAPPVLVGQLNVGEQQVNVAVGAVRGIREAREVIEQERAPQA